MSGRLGEAGAFASEHPWLIGSLAALGWWGFVYAALTAENAILRGVWLVGGLLTLALGFKLVVIDR